MAAPALGYAIGMNPISMELFVTRMVRDKRECIVLRASCIIASLCLYLRIIYASEGWQSVCEMRGAKHRREQKTKVG